MSSNEGIFHSFRYILSDVKIKDLITITSSFASVYTSP